MSDLLSWLSNPFDLNRKYEVQYILEEGTYECVMRRRNEDSQESVSVKIFKHNDSKKVSMMKKLMSYNFHHRNVVVFMDHFNAKTENALVMEGLHINLEDYIKKTKCEPMPLRDIRVIIKQTAAALDALKSIGVIHTDIKPDNIKLVNGRPPTVKLIDCSLAMARCDAKPGMTVQTLKYRSPEIILGLPFSEAIDMWSLGCVMANMITGNLLAPANNEYEALGHIVSCMGQPMDRLLNDGLKTKRYFTRTETNGWRLKTPLEYAGPWGLFLWWPSELKLLDYLKKEHLEEDNDAEAVKRRQCIKLLKAMLRKDATRRITPSEVLTHPFITQKKEEKNIQPDHCSTSHATSMTEIVMFLPSDVIHVQPAKAENTLQLEDQESAVSLQTQVNDTSTSDCEPPATAPMDNQTNTTTIQPNHCSPSPTIPRSRVIHVQPAKPENTLQLEDLESAVSLQAGLEKTPEQTSEPSMTVTENDTTSSPCDEKQAPQSPAPVSELSSKKKKKKNCFQRFGSWMKKTFCSCLTCDNAWGENFHHAVLRLSGVCRVAPENVF